jgi:alpha-D-ribose 1-methylphosphonate 5-triphosphate synthase subunit PhnH
MTLDDGRFDPVFDTQIAFRHLLDAMAQPGTLPTLTVRDGNSPVAAWSHLPVVLRTLLDHEVTFAVVWADSDSSKVARLASYLATNLGSKPVGVEEADIVVAINGLPPGLLPRLRRGTPASPDQAATLSVLVPDLRSAPDGDTLLLTGLGVTSSRTVCVDGLTATGLAQLARVNDTPPLGIVVVLIDELGHLFGLPRSTRVLSQPAHDSVPRDGSFA